MFSPSRPVRTALGLALAALALLVAACGDSDDSQSDAERWAEEVCSSALVWQDEVGATVTGLMADLPEELAADGLDAISDTLGEIAETSRQTLDEISSAELPETEGGQALQAEVDQITTAMGDIADEAENVVAALDEGLPAVIQAAGPAFTVATESLTQVSEAWAAIGELDLTAEVREAIENDTSCQELTN